MSEPFPASLLTPDAAAGHALAQRLANLLLPTAPADSDMARHLRAAPPAVSEELATAIYFHAITVANGGWRESTTR